MRKHLIRIKALLTDRKGNMFPLVVAVTITMLLIILVVSEYMRLMITAAGIKDAMESAVISTVNFLLGLEEDGDGYVRLDSSGAREYRISNLSVVLPNTPLAVEGGHYYADASIKLEVPVRFAGRIITDMKIDLKARAAYTEKF